MIKYAKKLWPINRSLTGEGVDKTLKLIKKKIPIKVIKFKTGQKVFDWKIPYVWKIKEAWVKNSKNKKIIDFKKNNLHLVGYSKKVNKSFNLKELKKKLHTLKKQPNAIPYVTSYYKKDWGFCLEYNKFQKLEKDNYHVCIDSKFDKGNLKIGELFIKGKTNKEILFSTCICHPSMANKKISGIVVNTYLAKWVLNNNLKYSYRFLFLPETIGSIAYLSKYKKILKKNIVAGYVLTCIGDNKNFSLLKSKESQTLSNDVAKYVLKSKNKSKIYDWTDRGSDERQFCSPGIDLPVASIMRTKYNEYPEYHTSLDKIGKVVSAKGLTGGLNYAKEIIKNLEIQKFPKSTVLCEPFLSKRGVYPTISKKGSVKKEIKEILDFLSYCDGKKSVLQILNQMKLNKNKKKKILNFLLKNKLIKLNNYPS